MIDRIDAHLKVNGKADYAADVFVKNLCHGFIVTTSATKGRVRSIDTTRAAQMPGVVAVITHANAPVLQGLAHKTSPIDRILDVLQDDRVRYNDQPVAVVVADTLENAQEAARFVRIDVDTAPHTTDMAAALHDATALYEPAKLLGDQPGQTKRGDVDAAITRAPYTVDATYTSPLQNHNAIELHATTAVWLAPDRLTVYDATQSLFGVQKRLAAAFSLPAENVRVISHYTGGGFGSKGVPWHHVVLAALSAKVVGHPVKIVVTRPQTFSLVGHRSGIEQRVQLAAQEDGTLTAIKHEVWSESPRDEDWCDGAAKQTRMLYACDNVVTAHHVVRLDTPSPCPQRAPGEAPGTYALECAVDELAVAMKLDPLALRLKNYAESDPDNLKPWSSKALRTCYTVAADRFGWSERRRGTGMATAVYPSHKQSASARAIAKSDGSFVVQAGTQEIGNGSRTIFLELAAESLGVPVDKVRLDIGDTAYPETPGSGGSRTTASTGPAIQGACRVLKEKLASAHVERDQNGDVVAEYTEKPPSDKDAKTSSYAFGAHFVEVAVDLGQVRVQRVVSAFCVGRAMNVKLAKSQLMGGIVWGIGFALMEKTVRDPSGRIVTRDLADYHVPVNADVPPIEIMIVDEPDHDVDAIGAKGLGELGITGITAAIANAVFSATGKRVRDLPITPDKLVS